MLELICICSHYTGRSLPHIYIYTYIRFFRAGPQLLWTQAQSWISLSGVFLNSTVSFCVCWSSITRSFYDPCPCLRICLCCLVVAFSLCNVFGLIWFVCFFFFFQISSKSFKMFLLCVILLSFFAWLCRCFSWACCLPYPLTVTQTYADGLTSCCPWPLLCFQVNDASQYVIMGIDNKLNILRFGQTCPCLKP